MAENIILLILGWLFGLLSPSIVAYIQSSRETEIIKTALLTELEEFRYRLMLTIYRVESIYGQIDYEFFKWAQSILVEYKGINSVDSLLNTIGPLLKLSKDDMATFVQLQKQRSRPNSGISLKKYYLSLLEANLTSLAKLNTILQGQLLEIRTHLGFMNETVDESRYYFRLSFQNNISPRNYEIANNNMIDSYKTYASQARIILDIIGKILAKK